MKKERGKLRYERHRKLEDERTARKYRTRNSDMFAPWRCTDYIPMRPRKKTP